MHLGYGNLFAFYYAINLARQLSQYLYSLQNWDAPHQDFHDTLLFMTVDHFNQLALVNIGDYSHKILMPFPHTNFIDTQTFNRSP